MSDVHPIKRKRTTETPSNPPKYTVIRDCVRSTKFWRDDGDTLFRINATWYRIHRILLALYSPLFQDRTIDSMDSGETLMDMKVFVPPCGSNTEWEHILAFAYGPDKLDMWVKGIEIASLGPVICAAKTLQFDIVVNACAQRLETVLPTTLDAFDAAYTVPKLGSILQASAYISSKEELFRTINSTLESNCKPALACAYLLALMEASIDDVTNGVTSSNGVHVSLNINSQTTLLIAHAKIPGPILINRLSDIQVVYNMPLLHHQPPTTAHVSHSQLTQLLNGPKVDIASAMRRSLLSSDRQGEWFEGAFHAGHPYQQTSARLRDQRRAFWEGIPSLFGLGSSWDDLTSI